jgi:hypothetical protein
MESEGSLPCLQEPVAPILSQINPIHSPHTQIHDPL